MNKKILIWIFVILVSIQLATALGVRPAKTIMITSEVTELDGSFWAVNNDQLNLNLDVYVEGDLAQFIDIETQQLEFKSSDEMKLVTYTIKMPNPLPPGESINYIVLEQMLDTVEDNVISAKIRIKHKVVIVGEYPDKFITVDIRFLEQDELVSMNTEIINKGKKELESVQTLFYVNDQEQKTHIIETSEEPLALNERKVLRSELNKSVLELGSFEVRAVTMYDDLTIEVVKKMVIGTPQIEITYFNEYLLSNSINKYDMDLLNKWNEEVENVYVDVSLKLEDELIDQFRTKSVNIEGLATEKIQDYLDSEHVNPGTYTFDMIVNFWNTYKMDKQVFTTKFVKDYDSISEKPSTFKRIWIVSVVLFVIFINSLLILKVMKKKISKKSK